MKTYERAEHKGIHSIWSFHYFEFIICIWKQRDESKEEVKISMLGF